MLYCFGLGVTYIVFAVAVDKAPNPKDESCKTGIMGSFVISGAIALMVGIVSAVVQAF